MGINLTKDDAIKKGVDWLLETLPPKSVKEMGKAEVERAVKDLARSAGRFVYEQNTKIYAGKPYAFYLKLNTKWIGTDRLEKGPNGSLYNAEGLARHGVSAPIFGMGPGDIKLASIYIPPRSVSIAERCMRSSYNIPFLVYVDETDYRNRAPRTPPNMRWQFRTPQRYSDCDRSVVRDQLQENKSQRRRLGFK